MSQTDECKKENEIEYLTSFIEAYSYNFDTQLEIVKITENPDFICSLPNGSLIGIELSKVMRDPRDALDDKIIRRIDEIDVQDSLDIIQNIILNKEEARLKRYIKNVKDTVLILLLIDGSLLSLKNHLNNLKNNFNDHGFREIWLADFTGIEAYGDIELFCIFPPEDWGYYQRAWPDRKPYG